MKEDAHIDDKQVNSLIPTKIISTDENIIQSIDPLIEPLIDADELETNENDTENFRKFERKCSSILTLHPLPTNEENLFSKTIGRCTGILYALVGSSLFTLTGFIIKQLRVDFFDALFGRFIMQTLILLVFIIYKKYKIIYGSFNLIMLQIIRSILASCGLFLFYLSYRYIPLPDVTTFRYTQVIWTAILAIIILHERITIPTIIAIILTLTGVVCVAQPSFLFGTSQKFSNETINKHLNDSDFESDQSYRILGLGLALACAFAISSSIVLNKKLLVLKFPQSILLFQIAVLNLVILIINHIRNRFILNIYDTKPMFTWQFFVAASVSVVQLFSTTITQKAIKLEHPSIISVVQSSDILFAIILQNLLANQKSNWLVLLGSALVTTSILLVGIHKFWNDRKKLSVENNDTKA